MKVAVVTPTIGSDTLKKCIDSVQNQTYENLTHYIFYDGNDYLDKINTQVFWNSEKKPISKIILEENVGKGWYGHRVYAACSFLVNADVICYLDEDNWFEENHVESLVKTLMLGNDWAYSLRKIHDKEGNFLCNDDCESLGKWPVFFDDNVFHIDTSSFAVRLNVAVAAGHTWFAQWGADRQFFNAIKKHFPKYDCSGEYSLSYRLDGNPNSVTKEFFDQGNEHNKNKYNSNLPWNSKPKQNEVVGPGIRIVI